jgi:hypothetical protein
LKLIWLNLQQSGLQIPNDLSTRSVEIEHRSGGNISRGRPAHCFPHGAIRRPTPHYNSVMSQLRVRR